VRTRLVIVGCGVCSFVMSPLPTFVVEGGRYARLTQAGVALAREPAAMVTNLIGSAKVTRASTRLPLQKGTLLFAADTLAIGPNSALKLQFTDGSSTTLTQETEILLEDAKVRPDSGLDATVNVLKGKVRFFVKPKPVSNKVTFRTSNAVMGVRGTSGVIAFSNGRSELFVTTGAVEVSSALAKGSAPINVAAGYATAVLKSAAPTAPRPFDVSSLAKDPFGSGVGVPIDAKKSEPRDERKETEVDEGDPVPRESGGPSEEDGSSSGAGSKSKAEPASQGDAGGREPSTSSGGSPFASASAEAASAPSAPSAEPEPRLYVVFSPDAEPGVSVSGGGLDKVWPPTQGPDTFARQAQVVSRNAGSEAVRAAQVVEQAARDSVQRAQTSRSAAAPRSTGKVKIEVRVEGW
jgi:hypothetical protein